MGAEPCLYVTYRNLCIECCKGSCRRSGGVTMNKYYIRSALFEHITQTDKDTCGYVGEVLTLLHDIEVVIRFHIEDLEYLIEHFAMLSGNTYYCLKILCMLLEFFYKRTHFNSFGTSTKDKHNSFHIIIFLSLFLFSILKIVFRSYPNL